MIHEYHVNGLITNRVKRITSHAGHARFLATVQMTSKRIPRIKEIPSPYAYSPDHTLFLDDKGRSVFIVETAHRQFDVFLSPYAAVGKWELIPRSPWEV